MAFQRQLQPDYQCIWITGPPNSGKSTSLCTLPRPLGIISLPGEKGHASLPYGDGITTLVWQDDGAPIQARNTLYYMRIWREVEQATLDLINGKHGPLAAIAVDGMHKLYAIGLAIASDGESAKVQSAFKPNERGGLEGDFDPRCYGKSHTLIWEYTNLVASSKVPWRVMTSWAEMEKDDPDDQSKNASKHLLPDLPGKAARKVLGEVGIVLHALVDAKGGHVWQTKPGGKVAGAGIKGQRDVVAKVPVFIPQDFAVLASYQLQATATLTATTEGGNTL